MASTQAPATPASTAELLSQLTASTAATSSALASIHAEKSHLPPPNALSLLTLKSDLLLSYLHNLTFLLLLKLRSARLSEKPGRDAVRKLAELRVLLEKGVKPIEGRLRYQMDKVVAAAVEAERKAAAAEGISGGKARGDSDGSSDEEGSSSDESSDGVEHDDYGVPDASAKKHPKISVSASDLAFKPNPSALAKALDDPSSAASSDLKGSHKDGVYRPPRITATLMPEPDKPAAKPDRIKKSDTLDEFVASELSGAPLALPSIGTTIAAHGRSIQTQRERDEDLRRREYEETNFVRLPKTSRKDKAKAGKRQQPQGFGGEDWRSFAGDVDRIAKGVERRREGVLERSRKRKGDGEVVGDIGGSYEKRKASLKRRRKG